tara:strand:- start:689 stop:1666 length:978 start_codon:yes stop_codon:yes gene_type:complete
MYKLKQIPEDFEVIEDSSVDFSGEGKYSYFKMKKRNLTTQYALEILSDKINKPLKHFGFAGNKDKIAVTSQYISVYYGGKGLEDFEFKDLELEYCGSGDKPISLGNLKSNNFILTIRNLETLDIKKFKTGDVEFPNYFGNQRFSVVNHLIGKEIVKKNFEEAVKLIIENDKVNSARISRHLGEKKNDFIGAIRLIPLKIRIMYIHSYQSLLFNKILNENLGDERIPIIGFGYELESEKIKKILDDEGITPRDFIINSMPELSSEGLERSASAVASNFEVMGGGDDELNENMKKVKVKFSLDRGCYATVLIDFLLNGCNDILKDFV